MSTRNRPPKTARNAQDATDKLAQLVLRGDHVAALREAQRIEAERMKRAMMARQNHPNPGRM